MKPYTNEQLLFLLFALLSMEEYVLPVDDLLNILNAPEKQYQDDAATMVEKTVGTVSLLLCYFVAVSPHKKVYVVIDEIVCTPLPPF